MAKNVLEGKTMFCELCFAHTSLRKLIVASKPRHIRVGAAGLGSGCLTIHPGSADL